MTKDKDKIMQFETFKYLKISIRPVTDVSKIADFSTVQYSTVQVSLSDNCHLGGRLKIVLLKFDCMALFACSVVIFSRLPIFSQRSL